MELSIIISNIVLSMREFQKQNCITKQCVTNTQFLYDCITMSIRNSNVKVKAVLGFSNDDVTDTCVFVGGHLVLILDDNETVIDPSYDIFRLKNISYYDNIKDLIDIFKDKSELKKRFDLKKMLSEHIQFMKLAEQINNGEFIIYYEQFYNNQADYIEKLYSKYMLFKS